MVDFELEQIGFLGRVAAGRGISVPFIVSTSRLGERKRETEDEKKREIPPSVVLSVCGR